VSGDNNLGRPFFFLPEEDLRMQCYEFCESVRRGIRVEYPHGLLLRMANEDADLKIPLSDDTRAWLCSELRIVPDGMHFLFLRAALRQEESGPCIATAPYSNRALILVRTMPGEGGTIAYRHNSHVEPALTMDRDVYEACSDRLFVAHPGGLIRIIRTGELEGAPSELVVGWDGQWLHDLRSAQPHSVSPPGSRDREAAARLLEGGGTSPSLTA
jgi:hypothetical protein